MPQLSPQDSPQFRGFVRPGRLVSETRPERVAPGQGPQRASEQHSKDSGLRTRIESALGNHPRTVTYGMFTQGLSLLGVRPTPQTLTQLADLADSNPDQFHELVGHARRNYVVAADKLRGQERRRRRANKS